MLRLLIRSILWLMVAMALGLPGCDSKNIGRQPAKNADEAAIERDSLVQDVKAGP